VPTCARTSATLAARDAASIERLKAALGEREPIVVPRLEGDVQDVEGLIALYRHLERGSPGADGRDS
jgi:hypothetical protein